MDDALSRIDRRFDRLDSEVMGLRHDMVAGFSDLRRDMDTRFEQLRRDLFHGAIALAAGYLTLAAALVAAIR